MLWSRRVTVKSSLLMHLGLQLLFAVKGGSFHTDPLIGQRQLFHHSLQRALPVRDSRLNGGAPYQIFHLQLLLTLSSTPSSNLLTT